MMLQRLFAVALVALGLSACLPVTSKTAPGESVGFKNDPALSGTWEGKADPDSADVTFFHFIPRDDGTITFLGVSTPQKDTSGGWGLYTLTTATLGGHRYINAREIMDDGKEASPDDRKKNIPLLYTIDGDTLTLYLLDEDLTQKAIEDRRHGDQGAVHHRRRDHRGRQGARCAAGERRGPEAVQAVHRAPPGAVKRVQWLERCRIVPASPVS